MSTIVITIISLCAIGIASAVILYLVAQKFKVEEDPRIDIVEGLLPGANCGGCGYPGCRGLAEAAVKSDTLDGISCPVGGVSTMSQIAAALGREVKAQAPKIAVVRCNGNCTNRPRTSEYDGARSCAIEHSLYVGDTACAFGCLGCGDCVTACPFDAIHMNPETLLPEVSDDKCVACGACVKACPRNIIELRNKGPKDRRVFVSCVNKDKGGVARKACKVACIGCGKCVKECPFEAITLENNLAYIDYSKCRLCRKCVSVCPTGAIHETNFPPRKITEDTPAKPAAPKPAPAPTKPENTQKPEEKTIKPETAPIARTETVSPTKPEDIKKSEEATVKPETTTAPEGKAEPVPAVEPAESEKTATAGTVPDKTAEPVAAAKAETAEPAPMEEKQAEEPIALQTEQEKASSEKTASLKTEEPEIDFKI